MAKFIAISGPSSTGKSSLIDELSQYPELSKVIFLPDIFSKVWYDLVDTGYFSEYEDISRDTEYLCIFIQRIINYYKECIDEYRDKDVVVILDSCWIDISIYAILNMWYTHAVKDVQEGLLRQLSSYDEMIDKIYITQYDKSKERVEKYKLPFKRYNVKYNRALELQYYKLASHLKNSSVLPTSNNTDSAMYIINELQKLGYL